MLQVLKLLKSVNLVKLAYISHPVDNEHWYILGIHDALYECIAPQIIEIVILHPIEDDPKKSRFTNLRH